MSKLLIAPTAPSNRNTVQVECPPPEPASHDRGDSGIALLSARDRRDWDDYVDSHPDATLFHTLVWSDAVAAAFPHRPLHLIARRGNNITGLLPFVLVRSRLAGRMLISVPYGVGGGILADDPRTSADLLATAKEFALRHRAAVLELRSRHPADPETPIDDRHVTFERELPDRAEDVLDWLPRKARAAVRQTRDRHRLTADFGPQHLTTAWKLYARSMRRLASIAYPLRFIARLCATLSPQPWITVIRQDGRPVAGLITFLFRDRVMPYYVGFSDDARRYSTANFLYYTIMHCAASKGFRIFDFGRTRRDNQGSFDFKRFHGFEPIPLGYQRIVLDGRPHRTLCPGNRRFALARCVWPLLPLTLTNRLSAVLARDIPG